MPDLAPHYSLLYNAIGGKMDIIEMFLTAVLQGVGFTVGIVIGVAVIIFIVKRKMQDLQLLHWINVLKNFKR